MKDTLKMVKGHVIGTLQVFLFKEEDQYITYSPAIQLSAYGDTAEEAKDAFDEQFQIFLEFTMNKNTLLDVLLDLGWTVTKKPRPKFSPPKYDPEQVMQSMRVKTYHAIPYQGSVSPSYRRSFSNA